MTASAEGAPAAPRPRVGMKWVVIGVVAVVIIASVSLAIIFAIPNVTVNQVTYEIAGASQCQSTLVVTGGPGVYLRSSTTYTVVTGIRNQATATDSSCTVFALNTTTSGFSTTGIPNQIVVCANTTSPLVFPFKTPSSPFTGTLTFVLSTSYASGTGVCVGTG